MVGKSLKHNGYRTLAASFDQDRGRPFDEIASCDPVPAAKAGVDLQQSRHHIAAHAGTISPAATLDCGGARAEKPSPRRFDGCYLGSKTSECARLRPSTAKSRRWWT